MRRVKQGYTYDGKHGGKRPGAGRPSHPPNGRNVNAYLPHDQIKRLDALRRFSKTSRSGFIALCIEKALDTQMHAFDEQLNLILQQHKYEQYSTEKTIHEIKLLLAQAAGIQHAVELELLTRQSETTTPPQED